MGKRLAAANGTAIDTSGEKVVEFVTKEGHGLAWPFLAGDVSKTLKSVATTSDAGNYVVFTRWGGFVVNDETQDCIEIGREGNVYSIDAWMEEGEEEDEDVEAVQSFRRQAVAP